MKKLFINTISIGTLIFITNSCSNSQAELSLSNCGNGNFCYNNINFGPSRGKNYELGIKDGCTTAEGEFTKNYYLSSSDKDYFDGWMLGRSKCKQKLPNEGTLREEENSRKRAEYEIRKLKMQQMQGDSEEGFIDRMLSDNEDSQEVEY